MQLTLSHVVKNFGEKQVLRDINLKAESGKALGLLGRNGAGKTTTIRIVMGVFPADSGQVLLDGKPFDRNHVKIGYLPEERGLYPKKIIGEQLVYFGELRGMRTAEAKRQAKALLDRLGMGESLNKKLETLSKGNQQKIQLAVTLLNDPDIVILDEPFSGLDPVNAKLLKDVVREQIAKGKIVFFSSHQMNYIEEFCDEIAILNQGKIVLNGSLREIKRANGRDQILLDSPELDRVTCFIKEHCAELTRKTEQQQDALLITLRNPEQKNALLRALSEATLELDRFSVYEPSLNDIFVRYTEEGI